MLFSFAIKGIDHDIFKAINADNKLIFDGALVIDNLFRANASCIWAAGPMTKYARKYHGEDYSHTLFNSVEVGKKLVEKVMLCFDASKRKVNFRIKQIYSRYKILLLRWTSSFQPIGRERIATT